MATMDVKNATGGTETVEKPLAPGRAAAGSSRPVALSNEDAAFLDGIETKLDTLAGHVDAVESKLDTVNSNLTTLAGYLDGVETKLDTLATNITDGTVATGTFGNPATAEVVSMQGGDGMTPVDVDLPGTEYETVAASQTAQELGAGSPQAAGDLIVGILVIPATTSPGNVLLLDGATSITVFAGGASSVSNLVSFWIPLGIRSVNSSWKITTGANVSVIAVGDFV